MSDLIQDTLIDAKDSSSSQQNLCSSSIDEFFDKKNKEHQEREEYNKAIDEFNNFFKSITPENWCSNREFFFWLEGPNGCTRPAHDYAEYIFCVIEHYYEDDIVINCKAENVNILVDVYKNLCNKVHRGEIKNFTWNDYFGAVKSVFINKRNIQLNQKSGKKSPAKQSKKTQHEPEPEPQEVKIPIIDSETQLRIDLLSKYGITMNEKYYPLNEIDNYSKIFGNYDLCHHTFRHNDLKNTNEIDGIPFSDGKYRPLFSVCDAWKLPRKKDDLEVVLDELFEINTYNPLQEKFDSITWDGTKRAESIFIDYLGVEDTPLNRKMSFTWLYAAVKRALEPSCKFDQVLIIQGPQGAGKSLIFNRLSLGYKTNNPDISTKDGQQRMHRAWFVIWDELVSLGKRGTEEAKNFISEEMDDFRTPFKRHPKDYLRHFVFCGTTNEENFLKDYTGKVERRYWILKATRTSENNIVFKNFTEPVVEQVWAEVYAQYKADKDAGFERPLVLLDDDYRQFAKNQQEFKAQNVDLRFDHIRYATSLEFPRTEIKLNDKPTGFHNLLEERYFVPVAVRGDNLAFDEKAKKDVAEWGQVECFPVRVICDMLAEHKFSVKECKGVCKAFADWYHDDWEYKRGNGGRYYLARKRTWASDNEKSKNDNNKQQDPSQVQQPVQQPAPQPVQQVSIPGIPTLTDVPDLTGKTLFSIMDKNGYGK